MGSRGAKERTNCFAGGKTEYEFKTIKKIGGIKVLQSTQSKSAKLPEYARTSKAYIAISKDGRLGQLRIYDNHNPKLDIDLGHPHHHGLLDGDVHVHDYTPTSSGHFERQTVARKLTEEELKEYNKIIKLMKETWK